MDKKFLYANKDVQTRKVNRFFSDWTGGTLFIDRGCVSGILLKGRHENPSDYYGDRRCGGELRT